MKNRIGFCRIRLKKGAIPSVNDQTPLKRMSTECPSAIRRKHRRALRLQQDYVKSVAALGKCSSIGFCSHFI